MASPALKKIRPQRGHNTAAWEGKFHLCQPACLFPLSGDVEAALVRVSVQMQTHTKRIP